MMPYVWASVSGVLIFILISPLCGIEVRFKRTFHTMKKKIPFSLNPSGACSIYAIANLLNRQDIINENQAPENGIPFWKLNQIFMEYAPKEIEEFVCLDTIYKDARKGKKISMGALAENFNLLLPKKGMSHPFLLNVCLSNGAGHTVLALLLDNGLISVADSNKEETEILEINQLYKKFNIFEIIRVAVGEKGHALFISNESLKHLL